MTLGDLILQNFFGIVASVLASVLGFLAVRLLRGIRASTDRTEVHAEETAKKVSNLDKISTGSWQHDIDSWKQEIERRVSAVADGDSDGLAWQAMIDRRLGAVERFAEELNAYAHGTSTLPTYTRPQQLVEKDPALVSGS